jgi:hypothetical protein
MVQSEVHLQRRRNGRVLGEVPLILLCTLALLLSPCLANAQVLYGSLTGSITDPSQAVVPGATAQVVNLGTNVTKTATTNESGIYLFGDLQPGLYRVTIMAKSFGTVTSEGLSIEANRVRRFDATLKLAQLTESVIITAGAEALQTDRADVNVNVTSRQITNLPVGGSMGRNYQSLMTIVPGAVMYGEQNSDAGNPQRAISVNVNGVSRLQNNTKLDGTSIIYPWLPTNVAYVPSIRTGSGLEGNGRSPQLDFPYGLSAVGWIACWRGNQVGEADRYRLLISVNRIACVA